MHLESVIDKYTLCVCVCVCVCMCVCESFSCVQLHGLACQDPLSMGFSRQEYWNGLPFSSPGDPPDPGIQPGSPALQADFLSLSQSDPLHSIQRLPNSNSEKKPKSLQWPLRSSGFWCFIISDFITYCSPSAPPAPASWALVSPLMLKLIPTLEALSGCFLH